MLKIRIVKQKSKNMMKKTLGGDRLGSGKKMKVELHNYERSTHDLGYLWRSTMSAGTLVPFMCQVALPGDTFDVGLDCDIKTHPTVGPLFGSYKVQLDVFHAPVRLYQGQLHNNKLGIGMNMAAVKLPVFDLLAQAFTITPETDLDNCQINPSCILKYLGISGIGVYNQTPPNTGSRRFNAVPWLAYWDIYKNYYANKQEEIGAVIHREWDIINSVVQIDINANIVPQNPTSSIIIVNPNEIITVDYNPGIGSPDPETILFTTDKGIFSLTELSINVTDDGAGTILATVGQSLGTITVYNWLMATNQIPVSTQPMVRTFPLENIDKMREQLLSGTTQTSALIVNTIATVNSLTPYTWMLNWMQGGTISPYISTQEGLAVKTYQSDLFNNWLSTEWIDGVGGINEVTAIDTSSGSFTIDTFILSKKVYNMLNRIAVSGGSYDDWMDAVYTHERYWRAETPVYHGGLIKELVFQEVVSNSATEGGDGGQPLGTLAGKGVMGKKHKGGSVTIKVDEPSYIIGIISLTPRIDYSQGNSWDVTSIMTMDDFHKPALDEIGFQELITEQMAWWDTEWDQPTTTWIQHSAGKQPAWINYMTNVNKTYGNFAIASNEMFMTLNRRYEYNDTTDRIKDLTTYIDPVKFNFIFAQTSIDAQNFWAQIAVDITARRKMSAKVMPNL